MSLRSNSNRSDMIFYDSVLGLILMGAEVNDENQGCSVTQRYFSCLSEVIKCLSTKISKRKIIVLQHMTCVFAPRESYPINPLTYRGF